MDTLLFHPKLVHLPIALGVLMPLVAGGLLLAWWKQWLPPRAWILAVALQAILVGAGALAMRSGEADEERVERVVAERLIEAHEEAAETFVWAAAMVSFLALAAVPIRDERVARAVAAAATAGTLIVLFLGYRTGDAGGQLVYRHGAADAYVASNAASARVPAAVERRASRGDDD